MYKKFILNNFFCFSIDQLDSYGLSPFLLAVLHGHIEIVRILLDFQVDAYKLINNDLMDEENSTCSMKENKSCLDKFSTSHFIEDENLKCRVSPIDSKRMIFGCWFLDQNRLVIQPKQHSESNALCGQFNALHLAILMGYAIILLLI